LVGGGWLRGVGLAASASVVARLAHHSDAFRLALL